MALAHCWKFFFLKSCFNEYSLIDNDARLSTMHPVSENSLKFLIFLILCQSVSTLRDNCQSPLGIILAESISPGYHTGGSHLLKFVLKSPLGIILCRVNLPGVLYPEESIENPPKHDPPPPGV